MKTGQQEMEFNRFLYRALVYTWICTSGNNTTIYIQNADMYNTYVEQSFAKGLQDESTNV